MRDVMIPAAGLALFTGGLAKAMSHTRTADPFSAFWCRTGDAPGAGFAEPLFLGHCWGCPVAAVGAALLAAALVPWMRRRHDAGRPV